MQPPYKGKQPSGAVAVLFALPRARTRCVLHLIHRCAVPLPLQGKALIELPYKGKTTIVERANGFILSLVDPDAPPDGYASLFEFGYGLRPPLRMTRGSFGKTTIGERAGSWRRLTAIGSCRRQRTD